MLPPLPCQPSPVPRPDRPAHRLFGGFFTFPRVAACTLARSPYVVTAIRRLQTLRLLHVCSGRFRLERSPGGACTHWKSAALSRRTWNADSQGAVRKLRIVLKNPEPARSERFSRNNDSIRTSALNHCCASYPEAAECCAHFWPAVFFYKI